MGRFEIGSYITIIPEAFQFLRFPHLLNRFTAIKSGYCLPFALTPFLPKLFVMPEKIILGISTICLW